MFSREVFVQFSMLAMFLVFPTMLGCDRSASKGQIDSSHSVSDEKGAAHFPATSSAVSSGNSAPSTIAGATANDKATIENISLVFTLPTWQRETNATYARRRPVSLHVIREDYGNPVDDLQTQAKAAMDLVEREVNCGYDVSILVGIPQRVAANHEFSSHRTIGVVCNRIVTINEELERRNKEEETAIIEAAEVKSDAENVPPLKLLAKPDFFFDGYSLEEKIEGWLSSAFEAQDAIVSANYTNNNPEPFGRPNFGAIFFNGRGTIRGDIGTNGYKHVFFAFENPPPSAYANVTKELPLEKTAVVLESVAALAAKKYRAPLWIVADVCRMGDPRNVAVQVTASSDANKQRIRTITNLELFPEHAALIEEIARMQAASNTGSTLAFANADREKDATMLFPDRAGNVVWDDENNYLAHHIAELLVTEDGHAGTPPFFKVLRAEKKATANWYTMSLGQVYEHSKELLEVANPAMEPAIYRGPVDERMVVYSTIRGYPYPRAEFNLLYPQLKINRFTGFTVLQNRNGYTNGSVVSFTRKQEKFTLAQAFRAIFDFESGIELSATRPSKLVLHLVTSAENSDESLRYVFGAYGRNSELLTSTFNVASAFTIPQRGVPHFQEVSLRLQTDAEQTLNRIEIQAVPGSPAEIENAWKLNTTLTLLGVYLVDDDSTIEELKEALNSYSLPASGQNWIGEWWSFTPLESNGMSVQSSLRGNGETKTVLLEFENAAPNKWAGVIGDLYPRWYIDKGTHCVRFKVRRDDASNGKSEVALYLYSESRVLAAWKGSLHEASIGVEIEVDEGGIADELAIVASNTPALEIEQLRIGDKKRNLLSDVEVRDWHCSAETLPCFR